MKTLCYLSGKNKIHLTTKDHKGILKGTPGKNRTDLQVEILFVKIIDQVSMFKNINILND
jgi:hypothetical protein